MAETVNPPTVDQSSASHVYHSALVRALLLQSVFVLLACLMLDGGLFRRAYSAVSIGYWIVALMILMVRPGEWGVRYLRHGVVVGFAAVVIAVSYWYEWVLDVFG